MEKGRLVTLIGAIVVVCLIVVAVVNGWKYIIHPYTVDMFLESRLEETLNNLPPEHRVIRAFENGWVIVEDLQGTQWIMRFSRSLYGAENMIIHQYGPEHKNQ